MSPGHRFSSRDRLPGFSSVGRVYPDLEMRKHHERRDVVALTYIKKNRSERLKLAIQACQKAHGAPLPFGEVEKLAGEFGVKTDQVRRIERRDDIDLVAYQEYRKQLKRQGVDPDQAAGTRIAVGGKATSLSKKKSIRAKLVSLLDSGADIDLPSIAVEFGLLERSTWPRVILSEIQKERWKGEKRPVSREQRELVFDLLQYLGGDFGLPLDNTRHREDVNRLLDRFSLAQVHKAIKNLYHLQRTAKALRTSFGGRVVKPFLDAIDFSLFRQY